MSPQEKNRIRSQIYRNNRTFEEKQKDNLKINKYKKENISKVKIKNKFYYENNKEEISKKAKEKYLLNKNKINKERRKKHLNKSIEEKQIEYNKRNKNQKLRKEKDFSYKLSTLFRSRISRAIKEGYGKKSSKVIELLGCDWNTAKEWVEKQWKEGMNWDNHGLKGWHIDHIIPVSFFNMKDLNEQKKCFHYTNLQPLWAIDNIKKSNKLL